MATPPTFVAGQPLTAAQMNTIGLHLVKTQTVGSGVSSVTVTGAFSADYDNYRILYTGGVGSTATDIRMTLGASATGYNYQLFYASFGAAGISTTGSAAGTSFAYAGGMDTNAAWLSLDIMLPYQSKYTEIYGHHIGSGSVPVWHMGLHKVATSYADFTVAPAAGTITGGTIRVYGYRNSLT